MSPPFQTPSPMLNATRTRENANNSSEMTYLFLVKVQQINRENGLTVTNYCQQRSRSHNRPSLPNPNPTSPATPALISVANSSLTSHLHHLLLSPPHSLLFLFSTFPSLISHLFAFYSSSTPSYFDVVSSNADAASNLFSLLSPYSILFHLTSSADKSALIKYIFPSERLPDWFRHVSTNYSSSLNSLLMYLPFCRSLKDDQVQLNVFEYYLFWFA